MMVMFTHCCPHCGRKRRINVEVLGREVTCVQCGVASIAADPDNESLAMMDTVKDHAELIRELEPKRQRFRLPR